MIATIATLPGGRREVAEHHTRDPRRAQREAQRAAALECPPGQRPVRVVVVQGAQGGRL